MSVAYIWVLFFFTTIVVHSCSPVLCLNFNLLISFCNLNWMLAFLLILVSWTMWIIFINCAVELMKRCEAYIFHWWMHDLLSLCFAWSKMWHDMIFWTTLFEHVQCLGCSKASWLWICWIWRPARCLRCHSWFRWYRCLCNF